MASCFVLTEVDSGLTVSPGGYVIVNFSVVNTGDQAGQIEARLYDHNNVMIAKVVSPNISPNSGWSGTISTIAPPTTQFYTWRLEIYNINTQIVDAKSGIDLMVIDTTNIIVPVGYYAYFTLFPGEYFNVWFNIQNFYTTSKGVVVRLRDQNGGVIYEVGPMTMEPRNMFWAGYLVGKAPVSSGSYAFGLEVFNVTDNKTEDLRPIHLTVTTAAKYTCPGPGSTPFYDPSTGLYVTSSPTTTTTTTTTTQPSTTTTTPTQPSFSLGALIAIAILIVIALFGRRF